MSGETANFHARYLYRDYLQVAECDLTGETPVVVRSYIWDPSEPEATRVLSMTRWEVDGTQEKEHLYCMHDAMKNVTSLFGEARGRRALYEYRPYGGLITSEGNMAEENKFRFSSEYMDGELGLVYHSVHRYQFVWYLWNSLIPVGNLSTGIGKRWVFMQSEFCKFCWGSLLEFCMGFKLHPVCSGCSFCVNGLRKTCRYPPSGKNGKRERSRKN